MFRWLTAVAAILAFGAGAPAAELRVQPNKENVVASRLEGTWRPHGALTQRLTGRPVARDGETPAGIVRFQSKRGVAATIPAKYQRFLAGKTIFMAGRMTWRGKLHPFIVTTVHGNPHVVYFRERDGDPMGDAESFNLVLAVAKDRDRDLLFLGGDFNNQPFRALERQTDAPDPEIR